MTTRRKKVDNYLIATTPIFLVGNTDSKMQDTGLKMDITRDCPSPIHDHLLIYYIRLRKGGINVDRRGVRALMWDVG